MERLSPAEIRDAAEGRQPIPTYKMQKAGKFSQPFSYPVPSPRPALAQVLCDGQSRRRYRPDHPLPQRLALLQLGPQRQAQLQRRRLRLPALLLSAG